MKFIQFIIALSLLFTATYLHADSNQNKSYITQAGTATLPILDVPYNAFASGGDTESGKQASCVSSIIYGLRSIGFDCPYRDFKVYQRSFRTQAKPLQLGTTKTNQLGTIVFTGSHFAQYYEDTNKNGLIDLDDTIIHAYFHPITITTLREWLNADPIRPIFYVDLNQNLNCPN